ncbi:tetratricopeptide repeat protein [Roseofilum capinflatum]|uniref:Serine/threonine-protein kinase n=1 Tax=Roseofilum capinflatum BLCC-M114 TaxID=3022440 RepID=A0ABT7B705_9CYAN|nr:serine/threonine-protein kinase [Roseofilum capinflatum]MDJ1174940.1 serine/threonine-protein kinase [Roseofilum capinflatum BLCC-M114]
MERLLNQRYQFIKTLGSNQLGQTHLVGDTHLPGHPRCVVKQLKLPGNNPKTLEFSLILLNKKAEALKGLGAHPQIPKLLDYFEENQSFYLVEEFVVGTCLRKQLESQPQWSEAQVVSLLEEVLQILAFVHSRGLIHRSVKPSNLIRRKSDDRLVLTGFGIFKEIGAQVMRSQQQLLQAQRNGSVVYVSPEQDQGQAHFNSDLYSLGMIGIQLLSGQSLLELSTLRGKANHDWCDGVKANPEFIRILNKMVAPDTKERYQLANSVLDDLSSLQPGKVTGHLVRSETPPLVPQGQPPEETMNYEEATPVTPLNSWQAKRYLLPLMVTLGSLILLGIALGSSRLSLSGLGNQGGLREAQGYVEEGNLEEALESYDQAIAKQPQKGEAYYHRGLIHQDMENLEAALEDFTQAILLESHLSQSYYQRGNIRFELGDRQGALADYTEVIQLDPSFVPAYVNRGSVLSDLGDDKEAILDYTEALELEPTLGAAYLNRCLSWSNVGDQDRAIADCTQAINLEPTDGFAYQNRGLARRKKQDFQGAIEDYNIAIRLDPEDPVPYHNRGLTRLDLGDAQGAIADFTRAIERKSDFALAYYDRGLAYMKQKQADKAIFDLEKTAQLCSSMGRVGCYEDAKYQLDRLPSTGNVTP